MAHAVILHTIQDAEHCLENGFYKERKLLATNANVSCYLRHHYELECQDLGSYLDAATVREIQADTVQISGRLLEELDRQIAPVINQQLGLSMRYFTPLFSLTAARQLSLYMLLAIGIERMLSEYSFDTILVYDAKLGPLHGDVELFLSSLFPGARFRFIRYPSPEKPAVARISNIRLQDIARFLREEGHFQRYFKKVKPRGQERSAEKSVLLFEPLSQRDALAQARAGYSFNPWEDIIPPMFAYELSRKSMPELTALTEAIPLGTERQQTVLALVYQNIKDAFCVNVIQYLQVVNAFRWLTESAAISDAYWEVPPFKGAGALLNEYCMASQGITVTGVQGQAAFFVGQTQSPYIPVSVFNRCQRYVTQGAAQIVSRPKKRKPADIAVYLTPVLPFTETGQVSLYVRNQDEILRFFNEQQGKTIHIVSYSIPSVENCAMLSLIKTLKNVTVIHDATQENYLEKYAPKLILMDTPTPYLRDMLQADVQVVMMEDASVVFDEVVLKLLSERIYYTGEIAECRQLLQMHLDGRLPLKHEVPI